MNKHTVLALGIGIVAATAGETQPAKTVVPPARDWKLDTISPVTNPLFFEDPHIHTEIRPVFLHHHIDDTFITAGGTIRVYAIQARVALTERLALIATKDGYIDFDPDAVLTDQEGWANLGLGFKYALIDDRANEFILTPGFKFEFPSGNGDVFQGNGSGKWDLFVSAEKGFGKFHLTANAGIVLPHDSGEESTVLHWSAQADYHVCRYFIPFVSWNAFTVLDGGDRLPLDVEGFDLINFGSTNADGYTQGAIGVGFRSRLLDNLDFGFAFEKGVTNPRGLFDNRFTVDFIWRF